MSVEGIVYKIKFKTKTKQIKHFPYSSTITVSPFMVQQASDATNSNVNRSGSFNQRVF